MEMTDTFIALLKDSPWIAITVYLLHRLLKREQQAIDAFKEGVGLTAKHTDASAATVKAVDSVAALVTENTHAIHRLGDQVADLKSAMRESQRA